MSLTWYFLIKDLEKRIGVFSDDTGTDSDVYA